MTAPERRTLPSGVEQAARRNQAASGAARNCRCCDQGLSRTELEDLLDIEEAGASMDEAKEKGAISWREIRGSLDS